MSLANTCTFLMLAVLATTACKRRDSEAVLRLDCYGDEVVDAQPVKHSVNRFYRFDRQTSALEIRGIRTHRFVTWGSGRVTIDEKSATYVGEIRSTNGLVRMKREITFDRSTNQIHDRVEASWGAALEFKGSCVES